MKAHLFVYGEIGTGNIPGVKYYTLDQFRKELDPRADGYVVHISSGGGDVFEGFTMHNLLKNSGKPVTVQIEGLCASIATLLAGAADKGQLFMNRTARFMIHNPHVSQVKGESKDLRNVAEQLDAIKTQLIAVYRDRTGLDEDTLWKMYDNETWLTAEEAQKMGFVDNVEDSLKAVARIDSLIKTTMKEKSAIQKLLNSAKEMLNLYPTKNQMTETLEDGRVIVVMSETEDWTGAQVTLEDGSPLEPGDYTLQSGKVIVIGDGSTISEVRLPDAPPMEDKLKEAEARATTAEARVAELEAALTKTNEASAKAEARYKEAQTKMAAQLQALENEFKVLNLTPAGDDPAPPPDRQRPQNKEPKPRDPMADMFKTMLKDRGF